LTTTAIDRKIGTIMTQQTTTITKIEGLNTEAPYIAIKRKEAIEKLGKNWLLHPDNQVKRDQDAKGPKYLQNQILSK